MRTRQHQLRVPLRAAILLSLGLVVCGCSVIDGLGYALGLKDKCPRTGNAEPPVPIGELRDTWSLRFGPLKSDCEPWTWNIVSADDQDRFCNHITIAACTDYRGGCPYTITTLPYAHDRQLAAHEFAHAALYCMGLNTDPTHLRADVWGAGGFVQSFVQ